MALAEPTGGMGRKDLLAALRELEQRYARFNGPAPAGGWPADRGAGSPPMDSPFTGAKDPGTTPPLPGVQGTTGSGKILNDWAAPLRAWNPDDPEHWVNGVNRYNRFLGQRVGLGPAPGPLGEGPGFWTIDGFSPSNPFYRSDWVATGDPNDPWDISGET